MVLPDGQFRVLFTPQNYENSVAFYRDGLNLPIDHDWDFGLSDRGTVFVAGGGMIELLGAIPGVAAPRPQGISLLVQVDDPDRWHQRAREQGWNITQEPTDFPWGHRILRITDPDGLLISLFAPIKNS